MFVFQFSWLFLDDSTVSINVSFTLCVSVRVRVQHLHAQFFIQCFIALCDLSLLLSGFCIVNPFVAPEKAPWNAHILL